MLLEKKGFCKVNFVLNCSKMEKQARTKPRRLRNSCKEYECLNSNLNNFTVV
jgi:hypothetical protein